jgi:DNA-binding transcriptional ArsR family regulator
VFAGAQFFLFFIFFLLKHLNIYIFADHYNAIFSMSAKIEQPYSFAFLETATEVLRAVAHPHRLLIIEMLYQHKAMNVTEVYERLGIEQAVASHHLRILKDRGIVTVRRDGKNSNYSLAHEAYYDILKAMDVVLG